MRFPTLRNLRHTTRSTLAFLFLTGALDTAHAAFFLAWTGALLFLAVRIVESKRWLG